jgi:hypothetical protein
MESACCKMLCCIMHANDVNANVLMLIRLVSTLIFVGKMNHALLLVDVVDARSYLLLRNFSILGVY